MTAPLAERAGGQIWDWDALRLSAAIQARDVSCVEVMTAYLDRIAKKNASVNAIVALRPEAEPLAEAAAADRELAAGRAGAGCTASH